MTVDAIDVKQTAKVTPKEALEAYNNNCAMLLDVRNMDEYVNGHAPGAKCIPVNDLTKRVSEIPTDCRIYIYCAAGTRSERAFHLLKGLGFKNIVDIEGGFKAWEAAGLPVERIKKMIPVEVQMRAIAGLMVFGFSLAGLLVNTKFIYGSVFVGFMLAFSAVTGLCPMLSLLKLMPWNRIPDCE